MRILKVATIVLPLALWGVLATTPGCSRQSEGERCDGDNGDEDCASGLVCTDSQELGTNADICCPPDLSTATDIACIPDTSGGTGGGGGDDTTSSTGGSGAGGDASGGGGMGGAGGGMGGAGGMGTGGMATGGISAGGSGGSRSFADDGAALSDRPCSQAWRSRSAA